MQLDTENQIANYNRHHTRTICAAVRELSPERRQKLLDGIQLRRGVSNLTEQEYDQRTCDYVESLLNGKRPKNGLSQK